MIEMNYKMIEMIEMNNKMNNKMIEMIQIFKIIKINLIYIKIFNLKIKKYLNYIDKQMDFKIIR